MRGGRRGGAGDLAITVLVWAIDTIVRPVTAITGKPARKAAWKAARKSVV